MTNHPTGDTALSRAITTGAPVATNDKQAAELTQRFKVGELVRYLEWNITFRVLDDDGGEHVKLGATDEGSGHSLFPRRFITRVPTPRPTPGGEWKVQYADMTHRFVTNGVRMYYVAKDQADELASRLNAADAMEQALTRIALVSNDRVVQDIASAALRGGA